jgi:hypothetical protein
MADPKKPKPGSYEFSQQVKRGITGAFGSSTDTSTETETPPPPAPEAEDDDESKPGLLARVRASLFGTTMTDSINSAGKRKAEATRKK